MAIDLQFAKIDVSAQDYPQKHNDAMDIVEQAVNEGLSDIDENLTTLTAQIATQLETAETELSAEINSQLGAAVGEVEVYRDQAAASAGAATTQAGIATTKAAEAAVERALAQTAAGNSLTNSQSAAAAAASIQDTAARVGAILKSRAITNVTAIAFKTSEGWEYSGNQSYKTESRPAGRFLGDYTNATAAWMANYQGVPTAENDYYWQTTGEVGLYRCTILNSSEQEFRAGSAHMPLEACFVAHGIADGAKLDVFDLTDPLMPLWMRFVSSLDASRYIRGTISALAWEDGILCWGSSDTDRGVGQISFKDDYAIYDITGDGRRSMRGAIINRNDALAFNGFYTRSSGSRLANSTVLDIAKKDELLAVATLAGVAVLHPDDTSETALQAHLYFYGVAFDAHGGLWCAGGGGISWRCFYFESASDLSGGADFEFHAGSLPKRPGTNVSTGQVKDLVATETSIEFATVEEVVSLYFNPSVPADSMMARRSGIFATPPIKKPEAMLICNTSTGTSVGGNKVVDFSSYADQTEAVADGWSFGTGCTFDAANDEIDIASAPHGANITKLVTGLTIGTWYVVSFQIRNYVGGGITFYAFTGVDIVYEGQGDKRAGAGVYHFAFRASASSCEITLQVDGVGFGTPNMSLASFYVGAGVVDYSGKSKHGVVRGTLTAASERAGAVAGLSGFAAATTYIELDNVLAGVGSGEAWIACAFRSSGNDSNQALVSFGHYSGGSFFDALLQIYLDPTGGVRCYASADGAASNVTAASLSPYDDGLIHTLVVIKTSTQYVVSVDGVKVASVAVGGQGNLVFHASARMRIGEFASLNAGSPSTQIWLAGAGKTHLTNIEIRLMHTHMRNLIECKAALDEIPVRLAYDRNRNAVELIGATYQQTMKDGAITASVAHGRGADVTVAVGPRSEVAIGGASGCTITVPERNLRERDLRRTTERFSVTYSGDAVRTQFPDPAVDDEIDRAAGARPVRVIDAGTVLTPGPAEDYVVRSYGLSGYVAECAVAPGSGSDVIVEFEREVWT